MSDNVFFVFELHVNPGQIDELQNVMREMVNLTRARVAISTNRTPIREQSWRAVQTFPENLNGSFMAFQPTGLGVYGIRNEAVREAVSAFAPKFMQPLGGSYGKRLRGMRPLERSEAR